MRENLSLNTKLKQKKLIKIKIYVIKYDLQELAIIAL